MNAQQAHKIFLKVSAVWIFFQNLRGVNFFDSHCTVHRRHPIARAGLRIVPWIEDEG